MADKKIMNVLIASDSFKDSLSSIEVSEAVKKGVLAVYSNALVDSIPLADGGEGTVDAFLAATTGEKVYCDVFDPLMRPLKTYYGLLSDGKTAVIELAAASGIESLTKSERNPLKTTTFGTGLLIKDALDRGCTRLIIGLGGSATNDGALGIAKALGAQLFDSDGKESGWTGKDLQTLKIIDTEALKKMLVGVEVLVACDVSNPLFGRNGAAYIYGPQKGANPDMVKYLDDGLRNYAEVIKRCLDIDVSVLPGVGAAGGAGAGLVAFLNAQLTPGFDLISKTAALEERIKKADVIITGEGKLDGQTLNGKAPYGVAQLAKKYDKPIFAFAGQLGDGAEDLKPLVFNGIAAIYDGTRTVEDCISNAGIYLESMVSEVFANFRANKAQR